MTEIDEVLSFSREYVNKRSCRTPERKAKIRQVIRSLTGERLGKSCGTCYIEAVFKIIKLYNMSQYELKRGYVAQFDGSFNDIKAFTNNNLLSDPGKYDPVCAEWARRYPAKANIFLVRKPGAAVFPPEIKIIPPQTVIIPPVKKEEAKEPEKIAENLINSISAPSKIGKSKSTKTKP